MVTRGRSFATAVLVSAVLTYALQPAAAGALGGPSLTLHGFGAATGGSATYTLIVANLGDSPAPAVTLSLTLPAGAALHQATTSQGACAGLSCTLGTVAPGAPVQITLVTSFGNGPLVAVAGYAGGSASLTLPGVVAPPVASAASVPTAPLANGVQQNQAIATCAGTTPSLGVGRADGYALLVAGGQGTPPLQCLASGCSMVTLSLQPGLSTRDIVASVEGAAVSGIWQYDAVGERWRALYLATAGAPLDGVPLVQGIGQYTICVGGAGTIVSH